MLKTNCWTYTIKDFNVEKILQTFYEKELLSKLKDINIKIRYYPDSNSNIED